MSTVIIQARMSSTRLPGKVLKPIRGKPMLSYTIETLKKSPAVGRIVLATSNQPQDDALVEYAKKSRIDYFRGSEENVLDRFYRASLQFPDDIYFRATGDNPILDYCNPERSLDYLLKNNLDYACEGNMPVGSIVEIFTRNALEKSFNEAESETDLEHVTLFMKNSGRFNMAYFDGPDSCRFPQLRLTVDYTEDFQRAATIIENLYKDHIPPFEEVIDFAKKKGWL